MTVNGYSGDAGNAFMTALNPFHICNGMKFTTGDYDNDIRPDANCAAGKGGWWYAFCGASVLTINSISLWAEGAVVYDVQRSRMLVKLN